jgi:hypothetical protein
MRRFDQNLGEKRVLLGSLSKKNNLRVAYEKLNLEERAFISTSQFDRRQLLGRQSKLRQLQKQNGKGQNIETRQSRTSLPVLPRVNEKRIRGGYSSHLTLPNSRNGLRSPGEKIRVGSLFGKEDRGGPIKSENSRSNVEGNLIGNFEDESPEKRNEMKISSKKKLAKVGTDSKHVGSSGVRVGDLIAYSGSFDQKDKPPTKGSLVNHENKSEKQILEVGSFEK